MTRAARDLQSRLPVSRNTAQTHVNRDTRIPLTSLTVVAPGGNGARKGRAKNRVGMWGTLSQNYRTEATHDARWSQTVSNHE